MALSVLLVEDLLHLRGVMADLLATLGPIHIVAELATEAEAKLWIEENPGRWDLAVIDLILEQGTGMGVIAKCRQSQQTGKVVVFSDYATPGVRRHCLKLGADAVFSKAEETESFIAYCAALTAGKPPAPAQAPDAG